MLLMSEARTIETNGTMGLSTATGAERRRGLRVRQNRPIKIHEPTSHRYFGGQTEDVSATGLRVELPVSMPVFEGHVVNIHVGLSNQGEALANRRHMMPAKVVWVRRSTTRGKARMMVGLELVSSIAAHLDAA